MTTLLWRFTIVTILVTLAACSNDDSPAKASAAGHYSADITRTHYGAPHIKADDWGLYH